ncbi:MAG: hypothetical protein RLZZ207_529, partial [Bacteroidota bacterium]
FLSYPDQLIFLDQFAHRPRLLFGRMAEKLRQSNLSTERNIRNCTLRAFGSSGRLLCRRCIGAIFYVIENLSTADGQRSTAHLM